jgi:PilZ domain
MYAVCEQRENYALDQHLQPGAEPPPVNRLLRLERRREARYENAYPARVWGIDTDQEAFAHDCLIDNISATGLRLRLPWQVQVFSEISMAVRLLAGPNEGATAAIKGLVMRDEPTEDNRRCVAVIITEYSFL